MMIDLPSGNMQNVAALLPKDDVADDDMIDSVIPSPSGNQLAIVVWASSTDAKTTKYRCYLLDVKKRTWKLLTTAPKIGMLWAGDRLFVSSLLGSEEQPLLITETYLPDGTKCQGAPIYAGAVAASDDGREIILGRSSNDLDIHKRPEKFGGKFHMMALGSDGKIRAIPNLLYPRISPSGRWFAGLDEWNTSPYFRVMESSGQTSWDVNGTGVLFGVTDGGALYKADMPKGRSKILMDGDIFNVTRIAPSGHGNIVATNVLDACMAGNKLFVIVDAKNPVLRAIDTADDVKLK